MSHQVSIKIKFRPSAKAGKEGVIYFQIIKERNVYRINTPYRIQSHEWDERKDEIVTGEDNRLLTIKSDLEWDMHKFKGLTETEEDVRLILKNYRGEGDEGKGVFDYIRDQAERLKSLNRIRCSETMMTSLRSFMRFRGFIDLSFDRIDKNLMERYEAWLKSNGVSHNSSSFYMRNLRTAYRMVVEDSLTTDCQPFGRVYTGVHKTTKRAISKSDIKKNQESGLEVKTSPGICQRPLLPIKKISQVFVSRRQRLDKRFNMSIALGGSTLTAFEGQFCKVMK